MSALRRGNTDTTDKLAVWVDTPPDFYDMQNAYTLYGKQKSTIRKLQRQIERIENEVSVEQEKPRSNEAKKAKLSATSRLKDTLSELEAELHVMEAEVKKLEYHKAMFNAATFRMRMTNEV